MSSNLIKTKSNSICEIGELISPALGKQMILDFKEKNDGFIDAYTIGKDVLQKIINQPGCQGIKIYNAQNEKGEKTLVYLGIDQNGEIITNASISIRGGEISYDNTLVGDRVRPHGNTIDINDDDAFWDFV
jgi:hypothetical protein